MTEEKKIRCYCSPAGNNQIAAWYSELTPDEKADADALIQDMRGTKIWEMPQYRPKLKPYDFGELRWYSSGKAHRLLGFFGDGCWYALLGCYHKGKVYTPADALDQAEKRMKQIQNKTAGTVEYDL